jgi:hypothetical protein
MVDVSAQSHTPRLIGLCCALLIAAGVFGLATELSALGGVMFALSVLLAWMIVRGSRSAWVLLLGSSISGILIPELRSNPFVVLDVVVVMCLVAPSSMRFIWNREQGREQRLNGSLRSRLSLVGAAYAPLRRLSGWDTRKTQGYGLLAWRLGCTAGFLAIPMTLAYRWQRNSGSEWAAALATLTWTFWVVVFIGFLVALGMVLCRHGVGSRSEGSSHR